MVSDVVVEFSTGCVITIADETERVDYRICNRWSKRYRIIGFVTGGQRKSLDMSLAR